MQRDPFLQADGGAKSLGVDFAENVHPVDGGALQRAVDAQTLMGFGFYVLGLFLEPQDTFFSVFIAQDFDESTFASSGLKFFK